MDVYVLSILLDYLHIQLILVKVPNIRFNVAKSLADVAAVCGKQIYEQQISPVLSLLQDDPDRDVRFYAEHSAAALEEQFSSNVKK